MSRISRRRRRGGFTLIELMIALVISSLLVGMTLSIFSRMSLAFRTQQNVGELQTLLSAAHDLLALDARQAGFAIPDGFFLASDELLHQAVEIENDADGFGPDLVKLYYADASVQARVTFIGSSHVDVDNGEDFERDDVAVIVGYNGGAFGTHKATACVVQIIAVGPTQLGLNPGGVYGSPGNMHCSEIRPRVGINVDYTTMIYRFKARAYRIDPARRDLAVLQVSPSGALAPDDWEDLGIGFTDLQVASRWHEPGSTQPADDGDADPIREWYSSTNQEQLSDPIARFPPGGQANLAYHIGSYDPLVQGMPFARPRPTELRLSLAVRTHNKIDTVPSTRTPRLVDPARPTTNSIGDRNAILLDGVPDGARPLELRGEHVYRYSTMGTDLRNLGLNQ